MIAVYLETAFADAMATAPRTLRAEYRRRAGEWEELASQLLHETCCEGPRCNPDAAARDAVATAWALLAGPPHHSLKAKMMNPAILNVILASCLTRSLSHAALPLLRDTAIDLAAATCAVIASTQEKEDLNRG